MPKLINGTASSEGIIESLCESGFDRDTVNELVDEDLCHVLPEDIHLELVQWCLAATNQNSDLVSLFGPDCVLESLVEMFLGDQALQDAVIAAWTKRRDTERADVPTADSPGVHVQPVAADIPECHAERSGDLT